MPDNIKKKSKLVAGTSEANDAINKRSDENIKAVASEAMAKKDSVAAAKKHLFENSNSDDPMKAKAMAGRAGNKAANKTRTANGVPTVNRFASIESGSRMDNSRGQQDAYFRGAPVEKDYDKVAKANLVGFVKGKKK